MPKRQRWFSQTAVEFMAWMSNYISMFLCFCVVLRSMLVSLKSLSKKTQVINTIGKVGRPMQSATSQRQIWHVNQNNMRLKRRLKWQIWHLILDVVTVYQRVQEAGILEYCASLLCDDSAVVKSKLVRDSWFITSMTSMLHNKVSTSVFPITIHLTLMD